MSKNSIRKIESFKDFKQEKIRLHYEIKLSEKRLQIKRLEILEALQPINFFTSVLQEMITPFFERIGEFLMSLFKKKQPDEEDEKTENGEF